MELFQNLKKSVSLILLLAAVIIYLRYTSKANPKQQTEKEIVIQTMTNIEVMGCILGLVFKHHNRSQLATTIAPHPLREKAMEHFSQFHDHPAVKQTAKMDEKGFPWDGFVRVALHYLELPNTKLVYPWNEEDQDVFLSKLPVEKKSLSAQKDYLDDYMEKINLLRFPCQVLKWQDHDGTDGFSRTSKKSKANTTAAKTKHAAPP